MLKKLMLAGVAVGMMALNAPIAHAAVTQTGCRFNTVAQETVTGGQSTFTGAAAGYALFDDPATHTFRCDVEVDGVVQAWTPVSSGATFVHSEGQVTYNAAQGASVSLCTEIDGVITTCASATETQVPPQPVIDLLDQIFALTGLIDPTICPVLQSLAPGVPGIVDISAQGDVTLPDPIGKVWDCPPYDPPA